MKFKIEITCDNAAFEDGELFPEISRILHRLTQEQFGVDLTVYDGSPLTLRDINGNRVGTAEFVDVDSNEDDDEVEVEDDDEVEVEDE